MKAVFITLILLLPFLTTVFGQQQNASKEDIKSLIQMLDRRFELVEKRFEVMDKRFDMTDRRFESLENRFEFIQAILMVLLASVIGAPFCRIICYAVMPVRKEVSMKLQKKLPLL